MAENEVGKITHFFTKISVGVIKLSSTLKEGDTIHIKGATSDFKQKIKSMQIEHDKVKEAKKGQSIGIKVKDHVREGDLVYKVVEEKAPKKKTPAKKKTKKKTVKKKKTRKKKK